MKRKKGIKSGKYQIDQSGKIEQTNINTVVALTNNRNFSIILRRKDKRVLEKTFKETGKGKSYPYLVFAALLAIILRIANIKNQVVVDREYMGHENTIRERALHFLDILGNKSEIIIEFGHVGKLSKAHDYAAKVGSKKVNPDKIVSLDEVLELVLDEEKPQKKDRGRKRLKDT